VLAWRAWSMLEVTGEKHAHTLLRQSVRFCVEEERYRLSHGRAEPAIRTVLPKLLDEYKLLGRAPGSREADDGWIERMSETIFSAKQEEAAGAVAAALAEGISPAAIGEAISLGANRLVLYDRGRAAQWSSPLKPAGSVHGDSVGVHASDAANAWRNIARVSDHRNTMASLIVGAYHTAGQRGSADDRPFHAGELEAIDEKDPAALLSRAEAAIRERDQARAGALVQRYGELGHPVRPVMDLLLRFAVSEDGALHAEKFYRTVDEEFRATRDAFRWRHPVALARVTASEFGRSPDAPAGSEQPGGSRAPGYEEACRLLGVEVRPT
jgi:hypothetical protein